MLNFGNFYLLMSSLNSFTKEFFVLCLRGNQSYFKGSRFEAFLVHVCTGKGFFTILGGVET